MKVVVLLLSCFALSVAQEDIFGLYEESMMAGMDWLTNMTKEYILSEDGTSFKPVMTGILVMVEPQMCPAESNSKCSPDDNWLLGCKCRKGFRALGECNKKPCQLFTHFKDNGPDSLNRFINAESYEDMYKIFVNYIVDPISRALCECPGMIGVSINCARKYDGALFQLAELDRSGFDNVVDNLDWKTLKAVLLEWVKAGCGERNGKDCVTELSSLYTLIGTMMDNTFNGEDICLSFIRFEEEFGEYLATIASFDMEADSKSFKKFANRYMDAYIDMEKEVMCEPGCAAEMSDSFYSCCMKHAMEVMSSKQMKKSYEKLFKNIWRLFSESDESAPKLSNAIKKYLSVYDPESFCGDRTDVYRVKNEQCDALEA